MLEHPLIPILVLDQLHVALGLSMHASWPMASLSTHARPKTSSYPSVQ